MASLTLPEIDRGLSLGVPIQAEPPLGSCTLKLDRYVPFLCVATHGGRRLRPELRKRLKISAAERKRIEGPYLGRLIRGAPITIVANDSCLDYDLDKARGEALHPRREGTSSDGTQRFSIAQSLARHGEFYDLLELVVRRLLAKFGGFLVYDFHSHPNVADPQYAHEKNGRMPHFSVGTELIGNPRFRTVVDDWIGQLGGLRIDGEPLRVTENGFFRGQGEVASFLNDRFRKVLVLPTGTRTFYMDPDKGSLYPQVFSQLRRGVRSALLRNVRFFTRSLGDIRAMSFGALTPASTTSVTQQVDTELARVAERVRLIFYINPNNSRRERKRFLRGGGREEPRFAYDPVDFDINGVRQRLYSIPVHEVEEPELERIFAEKQREIGLQLTLLEERGRSYFRSTAMELYGRPAANLHDRARRLLLLKDEEEEELGAPLTSKEARDRFLSLAEWLGRGSEEFPIHVELAPHLPARTAAQGDRVRLRRDWQGREREVAALAVHEVATQVLTTHNGRRQPLKILGAGLAGDTRTQEGLALLMEYLHGGLTRRRLRVLGARVVAVHAMIRARPFSETFARLHEAYRLEANEAFAICERAYRGGGFAEDYLYLAGLIDLYRFHRDDGDLRTLLAGRFPLRELPVIRQFMDGGLFLPARFLPPVYSRNGDRPWPLPALPFPAAEPLPCTDLLEELAR